MESARGSNKEEDLNGALNSEQKVKKKKSVRFFSHSSSNLPHDASLQNAVSGYIKKARRKKSAMTMPRKNSFKEIVIEPIVERKEDLNFSMAVAANLPI